jgi:hypothetical protein
MGLKTACAFAAMLAMLCGCAGNAEYSSPFRQYAFSYPSGLQVYEDGGALVLSAPEGGCIISIITDVAGKDEPLDGMPSAMILNFAKTNPNATIGNSSKGRASIAGKDAVSAELYGSEGGRAVWSAMGAFSGADAAYVINGVGKSDSAGIARCREGYFRIINSFREK